MLLCCQDLLCQYIESLPLPSCHQPDLLMVKATSQAVASSLQAATETLQGVAEQQVWLSR